MIKFENEKVILNQEDYNALSGIWGAFRSDINYCSKLLKHSVDNYDDLAKENDSIYIAIVDPNILYTDYSKIFAAVFINENYEVVNE